MITTFSIRTRNVSRITQYAIHSTLHVLVAPKSAKGGSCFLVSPPPAHAPEKEAKKKRPASIHAGGIAQFIGNPGVVRGVDIDIPSEKQIRHGHRHQRALHHAASKSSPTGIRLHGSRDMVKRPTDGRSHQQNGYHSHRNASPPRRREDFDFCIAHDSCRAKAWFPAIGPRQQNISISSSSFIIAILIVILIPSPFSHPSPPPRLSLLCRQ